ncbi:MAG: hypothetical protein JXA18_00995, partial [Chitinispirillaceae bacterium]|nr:hypothetical protein [Chitinispirillaceae bacterium]
MMYRRQLFSMAIVFAAVLPPSVCGAEDYATWSYSQRILLNTTSTGAEVNGTIRRFPVLIRLNPGNFKFFSQTRAGGADIRFAKSDGTHLPYQIERW